MTQSATRNSSANKRISNVAFACVSHGRHLWSSWKNVGSSNEQTTPAGE